MKTINLFYPAVFREEWLEELDKVFQTRWLGQGPKVAEFEEKFGEKFSYEYVLGVNSGTAALELAYDLIDIKEGDEVISAVFSCSATSIPLARRKAKIVFPDIDLNTLTSSYEDIVAKTTENTKAIVVVNLGGVLCDPRLYEFAKGRNIPVVVDACQSLGVSEPNGDFVCYSLQAIKHFTSGDGGVLVTRNQNDHKRAKRLRWFGIDREAKIKNNWKCLSKSRREICMDMTEAGYKFHMNDIAATLALVGLRHSDEILARRKEICERYASQIKVPCVYGGAHWLFCVLLEDRNTVMDKLEEYGIEADLAQLRNDIFSVFGGKRLHLPNMDWIESRYLYLPLHTSLNDADVDYIARTLNNVL